jgi:hypothetical protein
MQNLASRFVSDERVLDPRLPSTPAEHAHLLHGNGSGFVTVGWKRSADGWLLQEHVPVHALSLYVTALAGHPQKYILQNRLRTPESRATENIHELCALFSDLDYHEVPRLRGLRPEQVMEVVLRRVEEPNVPPPSLVVDSGRGLQLVWLLEPTTASELPRWRACQQRLRHVLSELGADINAIDASRVLRLIGTVNAQNGRTARAIGGTLVRWDFEELAHEIGAEAEVQEIAVPSTTVVNFTATAVKPPVRGYDVRTLAIIRMQELDALRYHRHPGGRLPPGARDEWLFLYVAVLATLVPPHELERRAIHLGREIANWSEKQVSSALCTVWQRSREAANGKRRIYAGKSVGARYRFRTDTIVARLGMTEEEMRALGLRHLVTREIAHDSKIADQRQRRRLQGMRPRAEYEASSVAAEARAEGVSRWTIYRRRAKERLLSR